MPFSIKERSGSFRFGRFKLDYGQLILFENEVDSGLRGHNLELLCLLIERRGSILTSDGILSGVWGSTSVGQASVTQAIKEIRKTLGDDPDKPIYIETVHRRGYRFIGHRLRRPTLAVIPFSDNLASFPARDGLRSGEDVATELYDYIAGRFPAESLEMPTYRQSFRFKASDDLGQTGQQLFVDHLITGDIRIYRRGPDSMLRLRVELLDLREESARLAVRPIALDCLLADYESNLPDLLERCAVTVSEYFSIPVDAIIPRKVVRTTDSETRQLYINARRYLNLRRYDSTTKARALFENVIRRDPAYGPGYAGLADCYTIRFINEYEPSTAIRDAERFAATAIGLDYGNPEPHVSLALIKALYYYDWEGAEEEFQRALAIRRSADTLALYVSRLLVSQARFDEAEAVAREAYYLESETDKDNIPLIATLYFSGRMQAAIDLCLEMIDLDPGRTAYLTWIATAYTHNGQYDLAINTCDKFMATDQSSKDFVAGWLGYTHAVAGNTAEAEEILRDQMAKRISGQYGYVSPYTIAVIHNGLGRTEEALHWLLQGYEERVGRLARIAVDPFFQNLRSDARFVQLLQKLRLR